MREISDSEYNELDEMAGLYHYDDLFTSIEKSGDSYTIKMISIMGIEDDHGYIVSPAIITEVKENRTDNDLWDAYCRESIPTDYDTNYLMSEEELNEYIKESGAMSFTERYEKDNAE